jgi:hypothetical protein
MWFCPGRKSKTDFKAHQIAGTVVKAGQVGEACMKKDSGGTNLYNDCFNQV